MRYRDYKKEMQEIQNRKNHVRYNCRCYNPITCTCKFTETLANITANKLLKSYQKIELEMQGIDPDDDFGTADLNWDDYDPNPWQWESDAQPPTLRCAHQWKATTLITSTVYDCTKCGIKKEKVDTQTKF